LIGIPHQSGVYASPPTILPAAQLLPGQQGGIARVLLDPERDIVLPVIVLNQVMPELGDVAVHIKMVINQVVRIDCGARTPKQFEEIFWIIELISIYGILSLPQKEATAMGSLPFADLQTRPTEVLDLTSLT